jgi:hypothetical protein
MSRSKTLIKSLAVTSNTHLKVTEIKDRLRLRTYDDVLRYLLGEFKSIEESAEELLALQ